MLTFYCGGLRGGVKVTAKGEHVRGKGLPNLLIFVCHESREKGTDLTWTCNFFKAHEGTRRLIDSRRGFRAVKYARSQIWRE